MQLDDWHAFVYRMRHSKVHFLAMENLIETTDWEQEIPRCFRRFGHQWTVPDDLFDILQEFASSLYSSRSTSCDVNDLRYELFRAKKGAVASGEFPLCSDCLCLQVKRANHQTAIWQHCLEKFPWVDGHGWSVDNGDLTVQWMSASPSSDMVLNFMSLQTGLPRVTLPICKQWTEMYRCMLSERLLKCSIRRRYRTRFSWRGRLWFVWMIDFISSFSSCCWWLWR